MNREIEYITNVTTSATLDATGQWIFYGQLPIADEVVVRQVTYSSTYAQKAIYQIWSSLTNGIIGTVCNLSGFSSNPGTRIQLRVAPQNQTLFQIQLNGSTTNLANTDFVSINLDFIKYRRS